MSQFKKASVVVPVDFSEESYAAVDVALQCVSSPRDVHVVHILKDASTQDLEHLWHQVDQKKWHGESELAIREQLSDPKYDGIDIHVLFGTPGEAIVAFASQVDAELIVMPSHGRKGLQRLLLGSVAERVIRLAKCQVLITRGPDAS